MKSFTTIILLFILLLSIGSCRSESDAPQQETKKTYLKKVVGSDNTQIFNYDTENRLIELFIQYSSGTTDVRQYSDFNAAGKPTKGTLSSTNGSNMNFTFNYDTSNRIIQYKITANGITILYKYTYHTDGYQVIGTYSNSSVVQRVDVNLINGNVQSKKYYENDVLKEITTYDAYDDKQGIQQFYNIDAIIFTNKNNQLQETFVRNSSPISYTYSYEYNADNYPTKQTKKNNTTNEQTVINFEYFKK